MLEVVVVQCSVMVTRMLMRRKLMTRKLVTRRMVMTMNRILLMNCFLCPQLNI